MIKDNVIELPIKNRFLKMKNKLRLRFDLEQRKIIISASLVSILFVVAVMNDHLMSQSEPVQARGIASVDVVIAPVDRQWEAETARELARENPQDRGALFAQRPSLLDQITYGLLQGKYAVKLFHGQIQSIEFAETQSEPVALRDRERFIDQYKGLLPNGFATLSKPQSRIEGGQMVEQFTLLSKEQKTVGQVQFQFDTAGRLLVMKVTQ